jgi:hypothetical protein
MILHLVLFQWKDGVTKAQVDELDRAMAALPAQIPEIKSIQCGSDLGYREGNASWAIAATFDDKAGWHAYQVHPSHQAVVKEVAAPIMASRTALQFEVPEDWKPAGK